MPPYCPRYPAEFAVDTMKRVLLDLNVITANRYPRYHEHPHAITGLWVDPARFKINIGYSGNRQLFPTSSLEISAHTSALNSTTIFTSLESATQIRCTNKPTPISTNSDPLFMAFLYQISWLLREVLLVTHSIADKNPSMTLLLRSTLQGSVPTFCTAYAPNPPPNTTNRNGRCKQRSVWM